MYQSSNWIIDNSLAYFITIRHLLCLWLSKVSASERRLYTCNIFPYWLRPCSVSEWKWNMNISQTISLNAFSSLKFLFQFHFHQYLVLFIPKNHGNYGRMMLVIAYKHSNTINMKSQTGIITNFPILKLTLSYPDRPECRSICNKPCNPSLCAAHQHMSWHKMETNCGGKSLY